MRILVSLLLMLALTACKNDRKLPQNFDHGSISKGVYSNEYFDFDVPVPAGWVVQTQEEMRALQQEGQEVLQNQNKELAKQVKASEVSSAYLFTIFQNPVDSVTGEFNPSVMIMAENLGGSRKIKTGEHYLTETKKSMQQANMQQKIDPVMHKIKIDGVPFSIMETTSEPAPGYEINQEYYSTVRNGFALTVILSYDNKVQEDKVKKIINTINFR